MSTVEMWYMGAWEGGACAEAVVALADDGDGHQNLAVLLGAADCDQRLSPVRDLRVVGVGSETRRHRRCQSLHACMVLHADKGTASPLAPPTFPNFVRQLQATRPLSTGWRSCA